MTFGNRHGIAMKSKSANVALHTWCSQHAAHDKNIRIETHKRRVPLTRGIRVSTTPLFRDTQASLAVVP